MGIQDKVVVATVKGFNNGDEYVGRGQVISVSEGRARELEANGLITRDAAVVRLAQGDNKPVHRASRRASSAAIKRASTPFNKRAADAEHNPSEKSPNKQAQAAQSPLTTDPADKGGPGGSVGPNAALADNGASAAAGGQEAAGVSSGANGSAPNLASDAGAGGFESKVG
ncbi:hypothetical protein [Bordetella genomosp. 9]|nr:hypothetical protein [Bordetella genomosp. 9]